MALDGGTAVVNVVANGAGLSKSIAKATEAGIAESQGALSAAGSKLTSFLTNPLTLVGAAAVGVVAKLGFEFEDAFTRIGAISNASAENIAQWRDQVLSLSGETAQAPKELADALFFLSSAGLKTNQIMETLGASAKASAVGLGDTSDIANITASALNAYSKSGLTAAQVTDTLVAAVREGRAEPDQFAAALGRVLPIASAAGVSFDQVAASLAGLSNIGLDVNEGVTSIRGALQAIVAPGAQAADAMKSLGLSAQDLLDAIQSKGLLGAFELLSKRAAENTNGQAAYLGVLRKVIPNVRALTGVLGLSGDEAAKNAKVFDAVTHSAGALNEAFGVTKQSPAFQFRAALNDLLVTGTELGIKVLPAITGALKTIGPLLKFAAENAKTLLTVFLLYKGATFLPALLIGIAEGLGAIGIALGSDALVGLAAGISGLGAAATKGALGTAALAYGIGSVGTVAKTVNTDLEAINTLVSVYTGGLPKGTLNQAEFAAAAESVSSSLGGSADAFKLAVEQGISYNDALFQLQTPTEELDRHTFSLSHNLKDLAKHLNKAGKESHSFAGLGDKALGEFKKAVVGSVQVSIGQFDKLKDAFTTNPRELAKQARLAVQIARTQQRDLQTIFGDKKLSDAAKQALASLPADQRHAFAEGGKKVREQIASDAVKLQNLNTRTFNEITRGTKQVTSKGGHDIGTSYDQGLLKGIVEGSPAVSAAAAKVVSDAIAAARLAAGAQSPSKKTEKLGRDLIDGLVKGMNSRIGQVTRILQDLVPLMQKAIGTGAADQARGFLRDLEALDKRFERLKTHIGNFKSAIRGAFTDASDLIGTIGSRLEQFRQEQEQFLKDQADFLAQGPDGTLQAPTAPTSPDLQALVSAQVQQAQQLAKLLKELQGKGLSTANLAQIAGQGAGGIPIAEALLQDPALIQQLNEAQQAIADITQKTADKMTQAAFGDKVENMSAALDKLLAKLREFLAGLDVPALKDETRDFINQLRRLNEALQGMNLGGNGNNTGAGNTGGGITIHIHGDVTGEEVVRKVERGLIDKLGRNGAIFNGAVSA